MIVIAVISKVAVIRRPLFEKGKMKEEKEIEN